MRYRIEKTIVNSLHVLLLWLTFKLLTGQLDWQFALGALSISGAWLILTGLRLGRLLETYFDTLSRAAILVPLSAGVLFSASAFVFDSSLPVKIISMLEIIGWLVVYIKYRINRANYIKQGHGPLPANFWLNPPAEVMQPGDLLLTNGNMAGRLDYSVGHGEEVLLQPDGHCDAFSSYMAEGVVFHKLSTFAVANKKRGHYIVLRLTTPLTDEQIKKAPQIAAQMLADNQAWVEMTNKRRARIISSLWLPQSWKRKLINKFKATGYDWFGLFIGTRAANRWTCIGACLELYSRLGVKTKPYGTGLLGLGTGLFNPIMPVRFLSDPAFRLLTLDDKKEFMQE